MIKRAVIDRTGHHYYADKDDLLRDRLDRRAKATGCRGLAEYLSLLNHPAEGAVEWQELEAEITIGETFFFRHAEQFAALQTVILPGIIAQNAASRRLRDLERGLRRRGRTLFDRHSPRSPAGGGDPRLVDRYRRQRHQPSFP